MGARRIRREQRDADQAESRLLNGIRKVDERKRRDKRMKELVKKAKPPYTPAIQSWLSSKLDKPSRLITAAEVAALVK
jgi:hypothetical protein